MLPGETCFHFFTSIKPKQTHNQSVTISFKYLYERYNIPLLIYWQAVSITLQFVSIYYFNLLRRAHLPLTVLIYESTSKKESTYFELVTVALK